MLVSPVPPLRVWPDGWLSPPQAAPARFRDGGYSGLAFPSARPALLGVGLVVPPKLSTDLPEALSREIDRRTVARVTGVGVLRVIRHSHRPLDRLEGSRRSREGGG